MPKEAEKLDTDKFSHHVDAEPKRDGKDYGPDDDYVEIVSSQAPKSDDEPLGDVGGESYSSEGPGSKMDLGGENFSQDIIEKQTKEAQPAPDSKPGENTTDPDADKEAGKRKQSPADKRISEVIRDRNKAQEEAAYFKGLAEGRGRQAAKPGAEPEPDIEPTEKPKLADFDSYEDFTYAVIEHDRVEADKKTTARTKETAIKQTEADLGKKLQDGLEKYDDFKAVANNPNLAINDRMVEALAESDNPADIAYYLGKNPDEAARISQLSAVAAGREIAKIDLKFVSGKSNGNKPIKKTSTAPDPIEPVNTGTSDVTVNKTPEDMTMEEYTNWRTKNGKRRV